MCPRRDGQAELAWVAAVHGQKKSNKKRKKRTSMRLENQQIIIRIMTKCRSL